MICRGPGLRLRGIPRRCKFTFTQACSLIPGFFFRDFLRFNDQ